MNELPLRTAQLKSRVDRLSPALVWLVEAVANDPDEIPEALAHARVVLAAAPFAPLEDAAQAAETEEGK